MSDEIFNRLILTNFQTIYFSIMKKIFYLFLMLLASCQAALAQTPSQISAAFFTKYPEKPSSFCGGCVLEVNPYYSTISDTKLGYSRVSYGNYTPQKEAKVIAVNVDRAKYGGWHPYPGQPNLDTWYVAVNDSLTATTSKVAKGHYIAFLLCAWTVEGAIASCSYVINEGLENQGQNAGTEFDVENLTRLLVGSKSKEVHKIALKLKPLDVKNFGTNTSYAKVDFWKGGWVDPAKKPHIITKNKISRVMADVYWNELKYGNQVHAFWFPNDISAQNNFQSYEIPVATLIQRLGFDPEKALPATN